MRLMSVASGLLCFLPALAGAQTRLPTNGPSNPAPPAARPVVLELFTSQGCSSCPPADALVAELVEARPDLLALTFHVTYWNNLGWQDPFSLQDATERQRRYVVLSVSPQIYTPAVVVNGRLDVVGSDRPAVLAALARARADQGGGTAVDVIRRGGMISVSVGLGAGTGKVVLLGYDRLHQTAIGQGENGGRTLREANIVRSMVEMGTWTGVPVQFDQPMPAGEAAAVIVQAADGRIVGAARVPGGSS